MNGDAAAGFARALSKRIANDSGQSPDGIVERAFRFKLGRTPTDAERKRSRDFLAKQSAAAGGESAALEDLCLSECATLK